MSEVIARAEQWLAHGSVFEPDDLVEDLVAECRRLQEERDEAMKVLDPNMPESGLVDAAKQVKQAAISWADNFEVAEASLVRLREQVRDLETGRSFRKREVVDGFQLGLDPMPDWFCNARSLGQVVTHNLDGRWRGGPDEAHIRVAGGGVVLTAKYGDYVIRYPDGMIWAVKKADFEAAYESVGETGDGKTPTWADEQITHALDDTKE